MKKSILALSVLSVLSFGASAEVKVDPIVITPLPPEFVEPIPVTREDAIKYVKTNDVKNGDHFDKAIKFRKNNENKYEFTTEQKLAAVNKQFDTTNGKPKFSIVDGSIDGNIVLINNQTGEQYTQEQVNEMAKNSKAQIVTEAQKRSEPIDGINPPATELPDIPVTREEAIQYIVDGNVQVKNAKNLDKAVKFRMNNEDKYEFTAEQKVAAVNKLTGNDRYSVQPSADGSKHLIDNETGHAYTPEQAESMAKEARTKIIAEAQKRAETNPPEGSLPPVENPEQPPVIEPDNEAVKQAVQNLTSYGYTSQVQMQQQAASINENAANIDELFNITSDLREDLELQGARNMAAISARAFTTEEGEFSMGVGLGGSGSENAMAIGGAYQINANWSVNTTIAFDTGSNADYGVGAHYSW